MEVQFSNNDVATNHVKRDSINHEKSIEMTSTSRLGIKWLELLETDFDKCLLEIDSTFTTELNKENTPQNLIQTVRPKLANLSEKFVQLAHKFLIICDQNTSLDRELTAVKKELLQSKAEESLQKQSQETSLRSSSANQLGRTTNSLIGSTSISTNLTQSVLREEERKNLRLENCYLRRQLLSTKSDFFGAKLTNIYLDKELSGRIQQIQILLNNELKGTEQTRLWKQIEAEICLNRHKAVVRSCRARAHCMDEFNEPQRNIDQSDEKEKSTIGNIEVRDVMVSKSTDEHLGISITGGKEYGIPILISQIRKDSPAHRCGKLYVGDAILKVNNIEFKDHTHSEAAKILLEEKGDCVLSCAFVFPDETFDDQAYDCANFYEIEKLLSSEETDELNDKINLSQHITDDIEQIIEDDNMSSITDTINAQGSRFYPGSARPMFNLH